MAVNPSTKIMTKVRAKMTCTDITDNGAEKEEDKGYTVHMTPVVGGSPENDSFYKWTPGGMCQLSVVNKATAELFEKGKQYYVDFTPADAVED